MLIIQMDEKIEKTKQLNDDMVYLHKRSSLNIIDYVLIKFLTEIVYSDS